MKTYIILQFFNLRYTALYEHWQLLQKYLCVRCYYKLISSTMSFVTKQIR